MIYVMFGDQFSDFAQISGRQTALVSPASRQAAQRPRLCEVLGRQKRTRCPKCPAQNRTLCPNCVLSWCGGFWRFSVRSQLVVWVSRCSASSCEIATSVLKSTQPQNRDASPWPGNRWLASDERKVVMSERSVNDNSTDAQIVKHLHGFIFHLIVHPFSWLR